MKIKEKKAAIQMRQKGESIKAIAHALGVTKSSVSLWVRDIILTPVQRKRLNLRGQSVDAIERRRITRISKTKERRQNTMDIAGRAISKLSLHELLLIGVALYWGEGGKAYYGSARLSNSDPAVIKIMMRFFREVCKVPETKFRGHVQTYSHLGTESAEKFWSGVSRIPRENFYRTYVKRSVASKGKRDALPNGTFQIYISDTVLFFTIMGWIEKLKTFG